jgi:hypothetical protein
MRHMTFGIAMALLVACAGCEELTGILDDTATVVFKVHDNCGPASGNIAFYIDGSTVGTATLSGGQSSPGYTVSAGQHLASANETTPGGFTWENLSFTVAAGGSFTVLLTCL